MLDLFHLLFLIFLNHVHDHVKNIPRSAFMSSYMGKETEWFDHIRIVYAMGLGTSSENLIWHLPTVSYTDYKSTKDTDY